METFKIKNAQVGKGKWVFHFVKRLIVSRNVDGLFKLNFLLEKFEKNFAYLEYLGSSFVL